MTKELVEGRDYDRVIAKMPRYDKEGHDVTGDKMGPGGRRKDDGRQSVQAYDFEEYNEESREELEERLRLYAEAEERERVLQKKQIQDGIETFFMFLEMAGEFLENHPELVDKMKDGVRTLKGKITEGFRSFPQNISDLKVKLIPKRDEKSKQAKTVICEVDQKREIETLGLSTVESSEAITTSDKNCDQSKHIELSREEALREIFNALNHYIGLKRSLDKLSNANVIDMKALGFEGVIVKLEDCMQQYSALMDKSNQRKILEILGPDFDEIEKKRVKEILKIDSI